MGEEKTAAQEPVKKEKYEQLGVSSGKAEVHGAIKSLSPGLYPDAFCKIIADIFGGDEKFCVALHADGAGTKTALAYAYWKMTGDVSIWKWIAQDALVMNLDDMLCSGFGLRGERFVYSQNIDRNKGLIPGDVIAAIVEGTQELIEKLAEYGIHIEYGGGETADVGDLVRTITLNATMCARMERKNVQRVAIEPGMVVVALASYGQATYENDFNAGGRSNGLTLLRHGTFGPEIGQNWPETFDPGLDPAVVYAGSYSLDHQVEYSPGKTADLGRLALSPTRTYGPLLVSLAKELDEKGLSLGGVIHNSGGGLTKVSRFIPQGMKVVKDSLFETPLLFEMIRSSSNTSWHEMYKTFNMGHGMEIYCTEEAAEVVIQQAATFGIDAKIIGFCAPRMGGEPLVVASQHGEFAY